MSQVLYSKYNSLRQPEFRIVTEIRENNGEKSVVKRAGEPAAEPMIQRIAANRDLLTDYYTDIQVIPVQNENNELVFPFVEGVSLKDKLINDYKDRKSFIREANALLDGMLSVKDEYICNFAITDGFIRVFGQIEGLSGMRAICPANIDALFANFMECDEKKYCIDYEWVFNFSVPIQFVRYRALRYLHYELEKSIFDGISIEDYLEWFGIGEEEQAIFEAMEYAFQYYVHGEKLKYHYLHRYQKGREKPVEAIERLKMAVETKDLHISNLEGTINSQKEAVQAKEKELQEKETHVDNLTGVINNQKEVIEEKEKRIDEQEKTIQDKDIHIGNINHIMQGQEEYIQHLNQAVHDKDVHIGNLDQMIHAEQARSAALEQQYLEISNAFFWKITKPMRFVVTKIKNLVHKNEHVYQFFRFGKMTLRRGPKMALATWRIEKAHKKQAEALNCKPTDEEVKRQRETVFPRKIKFSILVPLYNTPEKFLTAMIDSVIDQTYENWELCLADGSDKEHAEVGEVCKKYAKKDRRIKYKKLKENMGISGNTNACIDMATGDYIGLFDHDDLLHPYALYEYMKVICDQDADFIYSDENTFHDTPEDAFNPHFKPDFAPDTLRANNYICHFTVFKRDLLKKAGGGFRSEFDGSQDFDMVLRLTEQAQHIVHIPKILYYWRAHKGSVAESVSAKPYVINAAKKAIAEHLKRVGLEGEALDSMVPSMYRLKYKIHGEPLISILIPNKDHVEDLKRCIDSIREKSTYSNYEIIIIENNSEESQTFDYYKELQQDNRIQVVIWEKGFNYSAINNYGFQFAKGEHILLLNNDVEVISPDWLQEMLMYSQRSDVGAVGAKLYYPDHTIQHAGLGIGLLTLAGHYHRHFDGNHPGYMGRLIYAQDLSGVTAACMMMPRHVFEEMHGLDETFEVAFNDVDLCMRIRQAGYLIVFTPFAELYHYESKSRGSDEAPEKRQRFVGEVTRFQTKWAKELAAGDPYYNPNFSLDKEDFSIRDLSGTK